MTGHGAKFRRKQEEAIAALLTQRNIEEAAKVAGVSPNTLLRWLKVPEFQESYREARREAFGQATSRLQQASGAAVSTLLKIMVDQNAPASTRIRAAETVLSHAAKSIELEDIEARLPTAGATGAIQGSELMRRDLHCRIRNLERRVGGPKPPEKDLLPAWLIEDLKAQGYQFDASGQPRIAEAIGKRIRLNAI